MSVSKAEIAKRKKAGALLKRLRGEMAAAELGSKIGVDKAVIYSWEKAEYDINLLKLPRLHAVLSPSQDDMVELVQLVQPKLGKEEDATYIRQKIAAGEIQYLALPALDLKWLEKQPEDKRAGWLLEAWCDRKELTLSGLAETIGIGPDRLTRWINGKQPIDYTKLEVLNKVLSPSEDEMVVFTRLVQPKLHTIEDEPFIREKIKTKKIEHLIFPEFDFNWLDKQPKDAQPRLLLEAMCDREGLTPPQLEPKIDVGKSTIYRWFSGEQSIDPSKLQELRDAFPSRAREMNKLEQLVESLPQKEKKPDAPPKTTQEDVRAEALRALNRKWLKAQPEADQARLLIKALRVQAGWTQGDLDRIIGQEGVVSHIERGKSSALKHLSSLLGAFSGHDSFDEEYFREVCERSDRARKGGVQADSTQLGAVARVPKTSHEPKGDETQVGRLEKEREKRGRAGRSRGGLKKTDDPSGEA